MSATVHALRPFQSALQFKDRPNVYQRIVRAICSEQREGRTGFAPLHDARRAKRDEPKGAA